MTNKSSINPAKGMTGKKSKKHKKSSRKKMRDSKAVAVLSYLLVGIIWFFLDEKISKSNFARFHVKQAINLWVFLIIVQVLAGLMFLFGEILAFAGTIVWLILLIIGLVNSSEGRRKELPIIGNLAYIYLKF